MKKAWAALPIALALVGLYLVFQLGAAEHARTTIQFRDAGARAGITDITVCGRRNKTSVMEVNGSGLCWFDYNNDGLLDLYFVNEGTLEDLQADKNVRLRSH